MPPLQYTPQPYVRSSRLGDLLRERGDREAQYDRQRTERSAQMWRGLGQLAKQGLDGLTSYLQQREERPLREQEQRARAQQLELGDLNLANAKEEVEQRRQLSVQDQAFRDLYEKSGGKPEPAALVGIFGPKRGMEIANGFVAFEELQLKQVADKRSAAGRLAVGVKALSPDMKAAFWPALRQAAIEAGLGDETNIPTDAAPEYIDAVIKWSGQKEETPQDFTLNPGDVRFRPDGTQIASVPKPVEPNTPPNPTEASLAAAAAAGDQNAIKALEYIRGQRREPERPEDPLARRERELRIQKMEADLAGAKGAPAGSDKLEAVAPVLDEIETLSKRIFTSDAGPITNIVGAWQRAGGAANLNDDVREYRSLVRGFTPLMARAVGHNGVLTEQDVERTELLFPELGFFGTDNATVASNKLARMKTIMVGGGTAAEKAEIRRLMGWDTAKPAGGGVPPPSGNDTRRMRAPDGRELRVPAGDVARMRALGAVEF